MSSNYAMDFENSTEACRESVDDHHRANHSFDLNHVMLAHNDEKQMVLRLLLATQSKDDDTGTHSFRIGALASLLANLAGEPSSYTLRLLWAAPLHDVGKVGIPDRILQKPGKLDKEEWSIMQTHTEIGGRLLSGSISPILMLGKEIAEAHHEKFDGSGYPHGLAGEAIPLSARIVSIVDVFDALAMKRCYRPAFPLHAILRQIEAAQKDHFDPRLTDLFFRHHREFVLLREKLCAFAFTGRAGYDELARLASLAERLVSEHVIEGIQQTVAA